MAQAERGMARTKDGINLRVYLDERFGNLERRINEFGAAVSKAQADTAEESRRTAAARTEIFQRLAVVEREQASHGARIDALSKKVDDQRMSRYRTMGDWLGIVTRVALTAVIGWMIAKLTGGAIAP